MSKKCFYRFCAICVAAGIFISIGTEHVWQRSVQTAAKPITWVDFTVSYEAMQDCLNYDVATYGTSEHVGWIDLLAVLASKNGSNFKGYKKSDLEKITAMVKNGTPFAEISKTRKSYGYYKEAYTAVLGGFVGEFDIEVPDKNGTVALQHRYGLKAFSPIAAGYGYSDFDDFGASRSYGFKRKHLGHDMMGATGAPIVAVESGTVEVAEWNRYGGWRIGIRSFDKKRYYYYAHLRKDHPYNDMYAGKVVTAGDVIGYLGRTGYSTKENVNNIDTPHLHWGMQLIFEESQKDAAAEIWIDLYAITKLLAQNRSKVIKVEKEYERKYQMFEAAVD